MLGLCKNHCDEYLMTRPPVLCFFGVDRSSDQSIYIQYELWENLSWTLDYHGIIPLHLYKTWISVAGRRLISKKLIFERMLGDLESFSPLFSINPIGKSGKTVCYASHYPSLAWKWANFTASHLSTTPFLRLLTRKIIWSVPPLWFPTLQRRNAKNLKQIFPEKEYRGLSPNLHIHVSVSLLHIPTMGLPFLLEEICGPILGVYKSPTVTWMWKLGLRPRNSQKRNT